MGHPVDATGHETVQNIYQKKRTKDFASAPTNHNVVVDLVVHVCWFRLTDAGSELHTDSAAHQTERFAKSLRANGWTSIVT